MCQASKTIFDHIPKTGGTAIRAAMERAFGEREPQQNSTYAHHVIVATKTAHRFVAAHVWFYAGEALAPDWYYATLLRDPVDRFLSQYYFQRQHRQQVLQGAVTDPVTVAAVSHELADYFDNENADIRRSYANVQACHFAARVCERPHELGDAALLDAAITSLKDYDLVGTFAAIQHFVDSYCEALGVPRQNLSRENVTIQRQSAHELPKTILDKLCAANNVDVKLLAWLPQHRAPHRTASTQAAACGASFGTREIEIRAVHCSAAERVRIRLLCRSFIREDDLTVGIAIRNAKGDTVLGTNSKSLSLSLSAQPETDLAIRIEFNACLQAGDYVATVALHTGFTHLDRCYHWLDEAARFAIEPGSAGPVDVESAITFAIEGAADQPAEATRSA